MNHLSSRIAARSHARQIEAILMADRAVLAVDRAIIHLWQYLLKAFSHQSPLAVQTHAHRALVHLVPVARQILHRELFKIARYGHRAAVESMDVLPTKYLATAARSRILPVQESLLEADVLPWAGVLDRGGSKIRPGIIELVLQALGLASDPFAQTQLQFGQRSEPTEDQMTPKQKRQALAGFLFPPPSEEQVKRIVYAPMAGVTWEERLERATRTSATPRQLAEIVGEGVAQGKMASQIAKDLLPVVDGVRSTARRIARTESLRVFNSVNHEAHQGLGDMIRGYQIHATLDQNTRPEHAARNGTIYYVSPKAGQKGLDEMPHPPMEADGTEAWSCRCWTSPVLLPADYIEEDPALTAVFRNAQSEVAPDPVAYNEWFDGADEKRRRLAVGGRRYDAMKEEFGGQPPWSAFIDPNTGSLVPLATLERESTRARTKRIGQVSRAIDERAAALRRVLSFGSI